MIIEGKILTPDEDSFDSSDIYNIRNIVFIEEEKLNRELVYDDLDDKALHVVIYVNDNEKKAVAVGRLIIYFNYAVISHIAVLEEHRNKGYGDLMVRMLVNKAFDINIPVSYVYSPIYCCDFFEKIGFKTIEDKDNDILNENRDSSYEDNDSFIDSNGECMYYYSKRMALYKDKMEFNCR